jgi:hypothetical protein
LAGEGLTAQSPLQKKPAFLAPAQGIGSGAGKRCSLRKLAASYDAIRLGLKNRLLKREHLAYASQAAATTHLFVPNGTKIAMRVRSAD